MATEEINVVQNNKQVDDYMQMLRTKEELHPDLMPYVEKIPQLGTTIRHPLVFSMLHVDNMNAIVNRQYLHKKAKVVECEAKGDWSGYVWMHERPYRFEALLAIYKKMSDEEFWDIFGHIWSDTENQWQYSHVIDHFLKSGRPGREAMMDEEELELLASMPDEIRIFRGHQGRNKRGFSWSLSYWRAKWFAHRFQGKRAAVYAATIKKSDVIALIMSRSEWEIAAEPDKVYNKENMPLRRTPEYDVAWQEAIKRFRLGPNSMHGPAHWEKVEYNAVKLAKNTPGADVHVCRMFGILHDCMRENENTDPQHGPRAAKVVADLYHAGTIKLPEGGLGKLIYACAKHDNGLVTADPTIGCCWDADRLDLMRVNIIPETALLSTEYGKTHIWNI